MLARRPSLCCNLKQYQLVTTQPLEAVFSVVPGSVNSALPQHQDPKTEEVHDHEQLNDLLVWK